MKRSMVVGLAIAATAFAWVSHADDEEEDVINYVYLVQGDPNGSNSFQGATPNWSDGQVTHDDADYLVALGGEGGAGAMRTPANSKTAATFQGRSLTLGDPELGPGMILHKAGQTAVMTYTDLRLVSGCYSEGSTYTPLVSSVAGEWTVLSGAADPFWFLGANKRTFNLMGNLHGDENAVLGFRHSSTELNGWISCQLYGTNTAYNGSFVVSDPECYLEVLGDTDPLGAPDSPNNGRAVVLRNYGGLRSRSLSAPDLDPDKVVWVEDHGRLFVDEGEAGRLSATFGGPGILQKNGTGTLMLAGTIGNAGGISVMEGELQIDSTLELAEGVSLSAAGGETTRPVITGPEESLNRVRPQLEDGGFIAARNAAETLTLSNVVFQGGGVLARVQLASSTCSMVVLEPGCEVTWPLAVSLDIPYPGDQGADFYSVLTVSTALKEVSAADFVNATPGNVTGLPRMVVEVDEAVDGYQLVKIRRIGRVVEMIKDGDSNYYFSTYSIWSDNNPVHAGADYLVNASTAGKKLRTGDKNLQTVVFEGNTLTMIGTSSSILASLTLKAESTTVADLTMFGNTEITIAGYKDLNDCDQGLYGKLKVNSSTGAPLYMGNDKNRTLSVYSEIEGSASAYMYFYPSTSNNGIRHYNLYADNTNYFGSIEVNQRGRGTPSLTKYQELIISKEENLGGNPPEFKFDCLKLGYYSKLTARESLIIDDPNRGIMVDGAAQFQVDEDQTMSILSPLVVNGWMYKFGAGTLALGAPLKFGATGEDETPAGEAATRTFHFMEGSVQPLTGAALQYLDFDFSEAAEDVQLVIDPLNGDDLLRAKGIYNPLGNVKLLADSVEGEDPPVERRMKLKLLYAEDRAGTFEVPLLTVSPETAAALEGKIDLDAHLKGHWVELELREGETESTFVAVFTDIGGTVLIFR